MTHDQPDLFADRREERLHRLAQAETIARVFTGTLRCLLCGNPPNPPDSASEGCGCPEPLLTTVDGLIEALIAANEALTAQVSAHAVEARLAEARADAAQDAVTQMATGLGRFVAEVRRALGTPGPVPMQTARQLADSIRRES